MSDTLYERIKEQVQDINTENLTNNVSKEISIEITEKQKVYFWIRLYVENEFLNIEPNDDLVMEYKWAPGEKITTKFVCYGKKGLQKDHEGQIVGYNQEDDRKIICLLVDSDYVNYSNEIPFLRKLFKTSFHFEEEIIKRNDLTFINQRTNENIEYFDIDI